MKKKNIFFIIICAILIPILSVRFTVAFLTSREKIVNTYTIGKIGIILDETDVDELGVPIENAKRVLNNEYHLMPGYTYVKDPAITVKAGSSDAYIRMMVTINKIEELKNIFGNNFKPEMLVNGWDNKIWKSINVIDNENNSYTYEFRYYKILNGYEGDNKVSKMTEPLFNSFIVPESLTGEQLETIKDLKIRVIGQAIQTTGFEDNDNEAWKTFELQFKK